MADKTARNLRDDVLQTTGDRNQTRYKDPEIKVYAEEAMRWMLYELKRQNRYGTVPEQYPRKVLEFEDFSFDKKINLPLDYVDYIRLNRDGFDEPIRVVSLNHIDDVVGTNYATVYGATVGAPIAATGNAGLDEFMTQGNFSGSTNTIYTITLASGTTFNWVSNQGPSGSAVAITGDWQTLENGVEVKFDSTSGYTAADVWTFTAYKDQTIQILELNWTPEEDLILNYMKRIEDLTMTNDVLDADQYLPFYKYYDAIKLYVELKCNNRGEKNIRQDLVIYDPVIRLITNVASAISYDTGSSMAPRKVTKDYK
jgi:hypothetical protein